MQFRRTRKDTALFWAALCSACGGSEARTVQEGPGIAEGPVAVTPPSAPWLWPPGQLPLARASVDSGYPLTAAVDGACPPGTQETREFACLHEKRGGPPPPCACEYVCAPSCAAGEVCTPDGAGAASCACHAALEPSADGCHWSGLVQNSTFDGAQGWDLQTEGQEGAAVTRIDAGELELTVNQRCALAWAGTTARLPARGQFPGGAALVFDYSARGATVETHTLASALIDGFVAGLPLQSGRFVAGLPLQPAERATERRCAALRERPSLASLEFRVQVGGSCGLPVDYALSVDNVRLEADASCR